MVAISAPRAYAAPPKSRRLALVVNVALASSLWCRSSIAEGATPSPEPALGAPAVPTRRAWYDAIDVAMFVDAYASINYNFPKPQGGVNAYRAFDQANGFSLSWAGFNASYAEGPVGATVNLRFGPTASLLASGCFTPGKCDSDQGLSNVKQAFVSFRPGGADSPLRLDFGKVDTIYGAEVPDSQENINYSRGILYLLATPSFHTGVHATAKVGDAFELKGMLVNGWNNSVDNNTSKSLGVQATYHLRGSGDSDLLSAALGYLGGEEREDTSTTKGLRHLVDFIVTADPSERLHLVFNADFGAEKLRNPVNADHFESAAYGGLMLSTRLAITEQVGVGARAEYLRDPDGLASGQTGTPLTLMTGTLTLEFLPTKLLLIRLENRVDRANQFAFPKSLQDTSRTQVTTTLGVVARTN